MSIEKRKISYGWDSTMESAGLDAYHLDAFVWADGRLVVDEHRKFKTREEFLSAMEELVPLLSDEPQRAMTRGAE